MVGAWLRDMTDTSMRKTAWGTIVLSTATTMLKIACMRMGWYCADSGYVMFSRRLWPVGHVFYTGRMDSRSVQRYFGAAGPKQVHRIQGHALCNVYVTFHPAPQRTSQLKISLLHLFLSVYWQNNQDPSTDNGELLKVLESINLMFKMNYRRGMRWKSRQLFKAMHWQECSWTTIRHTRSVSNSMETFFIPKSRQQWISDAKY